MAIQNPAYRPFLILAYLMYKSQSSTSNKFFLYLKNTKLYTTKIVHVQQVLQSTCNSKLTTNITMAFQAGSPIVPKPCIATSPGHYSIDQTEDDISIETTTTDK